MVTVEVDAAGVESRLRSGELRCPACGGVLAGWGHARERPVRGPAGKVEVRPRRSRCTGCGATHVLLPVLMLLRRADVASVIMAALAAKARGVGYRPIAAALGRPPETVRGWLRRFAGRVDRVRELFSGWLRALDPDPVMPGPSGSGWADAITAIGAAARAAARQFRVGMVAPWELAVSVSSSCLLSPAWPGGVDQHEVTLPNG